MRRPAAGSKWWLIDPSTRRHRLVVVRGLVERAFSPGVEWYDELAGDRGETPLASWARVTKGRAP